MTKLDAISAELCRRSLYQFVIEFWDEVSPDRYVDNWHIRYICDEMQAHVQRVIDRKPAEPNFIIVNIPPGTSKSTIISQMLPAWVWCKDSSVKFITGSYAGSLAIRDAVKSRDIIQSDRYQRYFPHVKIKGDNNNKSSYETDANGSRDTTSVGGTATGKHAHIIIIDDPVNPQMAESEVERTTANDWIDRTLSTRKVDKEVALTIMVMQRIHEKDPTGHVLSKGKAKHICLPAELSKDVKPPELREYYVDGLLDVNRLSRPVLDGMKLDLGSYGYAGQMMQKPAPATGGVWVRSVKPVDFIPPLDYHGTDWDLAYTKDDRNSASAYCEAGLSGADIYITDIGYAWKEFPDLIPYMKQRKAPHYIEAKASGKSAKQTLVRSGVNAVEVGKSSDKMVETRFIMPTVEAGRVHIAAHLLDKLYNDERQGVLSFPNGEHDDLNDAVVSAIKRLQGYGAGLEGIEDMAKDMDMGVF